MNRTILLIQCATDGRFRTETWETYETKIPEVDRGYDFDIVVGKNATFFDSFSISLSYYTLVVLSYRLSR